MNCEHRNMFYGQNKQCLSHVANFTGKLFVNLTWSTGGWPECFKTENFNNIHLSMIFKKFFREYISITHSEEKLVFVRLS